MVNRRYTHHSSMLDQFSLDPTQSLNILRLIAPRLFPIALVLYTALSSQLINYTHLPEVYIQHCNISHRYMHKIFHKKYPTSLVNTIQKYLMSLVRNMKKYPTCGVNSSNIPYLPVDPGCTHQLIHLGG